MPDPETTIAAIFAAVKEDPKCAPAADALAELHGAGGWKGPAIIKVLGQQGTPDAD